MELLEKERRELAQAMAQVEQRRQQYERSHSQSLKQSSDARASRSTAPTSLQSSAPEQIGQLMGVTISSDPRTAKYNPPPALPCEYCGQLRYTKGIVLRNRIMWLPTGPEACTCPEGQAAKEAAANARENAKAAESAKEAAEKERERIKHIIGTSGMGERFKARTFDKFEQLPTNTAACRTASGYAASFKQLQQNAAGKEKNGLLFTGPKGTGKTHLAAAIANKLMSDGVAVLFVTMIDLLGKIKATFDAEKTTASEAELMRIYKRVDLLIIDDMGKELPTAWALSKIYEIINARYEDYKPLVITSNYSPEELVRRLTPRDGDNTTADATVDRILEMTYTVPLAGESWRTKK